MLFLFPIMNVLVNISFNNYPIQITFLQLLIPLHLIAQCVSLRFVFRRYSSVEHYFSLPDCLIVFHFCSPFDVDLYKIHQI